MLKKIADLQALAEVEQLTTIDSLETFRIKFLSKKGLLNALFDDFKNVSGPEKREVGKALNELKLLLETKLKLAQERNLENLVNNANESIDHSFAA